MARPTDIASPTVVMASLRTDMKAMECYLESLLAQTREHAAERERLRAMLSTLLTHSVRLLRQKEVLLELLGRQALAGVLTPPVLHQMHASSDDAEFDQNLARALKEMRGPAVPLTPQ